VRDREKGGEKDKNQPITIVRNEGEDMLILVCRMEGRRRERCRIIYFLLSPPKKKREKKQPPLRFAKGKGGEKNPTTLRQCYKGDKKRRRMYNHPRQAIKPTRGTKEGMRGKPFTSFFFRGEGEKKNHRQEKERGGKNYTEKSSFFPSPRFGGERGKKTTRSCAKGEGKVNLFFRSK